MKSSGTIDRSPTLTLSLKSKLGLHTQFYHDHDGTTDYFEMLPLSEATGNWIQVWLECTVLNSPLDKCVQCPMWRPRLFGTFARNFG